MRRHLIVLTVAAALAACGGKKSSTTTPVTNGSDAAAAGEGAGSATAPTDDTAQTPPAAGTASPRPASVTDEMVAVMEKVVGAFEALGKDLNAVGGDCVKGAAVMRSHTPKLQSLAAEAKKFDAQTRNDPAAEKFFEDNYSQRLMASLGGMMELSGTCASDADFQAASEEFGKALE